MDAYAKTGVEESQHQQPYPPPPQNQPYPPSPQNQPYPPSPQNQPYPPPPNQQYPPSPQQQNRGQYAPPGQQYPPPPPMAYPAHAYAQPYGYAPPQYPPPYAQPPPPPPHRHEGPSFAQGWYVTCDITSPRRSFPRYLCGHDLESIDNFKTATKIKFRWCMMSRKRTDTEKTGSRCATFETLTRPELSYYMQSTAWETMD
jgi:hypothetical protein